VKVTISEDDSIASQRDALLNGETDAFKCLAHEHEHLIVIVFII
jgi:hypothetical protein